MLLAGDVGGTKTLIGLFDQLPARPRALVVREYPTLEYRSLDAILTAFTADEGLDPSSVGAACFGVAGPVDDHTARLTNAPWSIIDARTVARDTGVAHVALLNDLMALAHGVTLLTPDEVHVLRKGQAVRAGSPGSGGHIGNIALIAAGTGLGEALLHHVDGAFVPLASESGHADFAARTELEIALLRRLTAERGRAAIEDVVSGRGLVNFHTVTHNGPCPVIRDGRSPDAPAAISTAALEHRCRGCVAALDAFVDAYGAEAGNLALRTLATGGVFVGGGIAPKILPALAGGGFVRSFTNKTPFEPLLERIPITIIRNHRAALLGAAVYAARLFAGHVRGAGA